MENAAILPLENDGFWGDQVVYSATGPVVFGVAYQALGDYTQVFRRKHWWFSIENTDGFRLKDDLHAGPSGDSSAPAGDVSYI